MNGAEVVVAALRRQPELLRSLARQLAGVELAGPLELLEGAPLTAFRSGTGGWLAVSVLDAADDEQRQRWPLALATLAQRARSAVDLLVLTSSKDTARWARRPLRLDGALGTRLALTPFVMHVGLDEAEELVKVPSPHLALAAAWAVQRKDGPRSRAVLPALLAQLDGVPAPERSWWVVATLQLLSAPQLAHIHAMRDDLPRSEAFLEFQKNLESRAEARGKTGALLRFLDLRKIPLSPEQRRFIQACTDLPTADRWTEAVFAASGQGAMLEAIFNPAAAPPAPAPAADPPAIDALTPEPPPLTPDPPAVDEPPPSSPTPEAEEASA